MSLKVKQKIIDKTGGKADKNNMGCVPAALLLGYFKCFF